MRARTALLLPAILTFAATGAALRAEGELSSATIVERGRVLYVDHYCGACHRLGATGAQGFFGPAHDEAATVAAERIADPDYRGSARDAAGYLRESITDPDAYLVPGHAGSRHAMPAYDLPEADLDALVAFLLTQDGSASVPSSSGGG